jgi:hypothetical protein
MEKLEILTQDFNMLQFNSIKLFNIIYNHIKFENKSNFLNTHLKEFNVISFSDYPTSWKPGVVQVNQANIASAISFVSSLTPGFKYKIYFLLTFLLGGGTAMLSALQAAFSDPNAIAVYLLSDGIPTDASFQTILSAASRWSASGVPPYILNSVSFQAGGIYDPDAAQFMFQLAQETGGIYRSID